MRHQEESRNAKVDTPKLSICIATYNRARFIGTTLNTILEQITAECEIVVVDGGSTDETDQVLSEFCRNSACIRYIRRLENGGVDADYDYAVESARGTYCWLFSDDDLMKFDAIKTILTAIEGAPSLLVVNGEHRDFLMETVHVPNYLSIDSDRLYRRDEMGKMFDEIGTCLVCICCVVINRGVWLNSSRRRYFGSRFIHVGVILEKPLPGNIIAIAKPLMMLRLGNTQSAQLAGGKVWFVDWPALIWSSCLPVTTKMAFCHPEPWRRARYLMPLRVLGYYSMIEYRQWFDPSSLSTFTRIIPRSIALLPRTLVRFVYASYSIATNAPWDCKRVLATMFPKSLQALSEADCAIQTNYPD